MPYSPENLQTLLAQSAAYQDLPADQKAKIEQMIKSNDKPGLIYVYSKLKEEQEANNISRQKLADKLDKPIQVGQSDLKKLLP